MLVKVNDNVELYQVPNGQWVISGFYPDYKELEFLYTMPIHDISEKTCTVNGVQVMIHDEQWKQQQHIFSQWLHNAFRSVDMYIDNIRSRDAWTLDYTANGHQVGHFHSTDRMYQQNERFASAVLFFNNVHPIKGYQSNGCLYTIMQTPDGYTYEHKFHPEPGRYVIMDDRVFHGAYPTTENRRCLVWNFDYNIKH